VQPVRRQEPGTAEEIQTFCSTTYGVTFPLFEKIDVNGESRNPVYDELTKTTDAEGYTGDIRWKLREGSCSTARATWWPGSARAPSRTTRRLSARSSPCCRHMCLRWVWAGISSLSVL